MMEVRRRPLIMAALACLPAVALAFAPPRVATLTHPAHRPVTPVAALRSAFGPASSSGISMSTTEEVAGAETFQFEAEVSRVMDIIINSLYSNKDIFLRELISNASDACDKKRFLGISKEGNGGSSEEDLCIRVKTDKEAKTITIEDRGVGMSREELKKNLGTIAQSGTKRFLEALKAKPDDTNLIGQFGVGFYSSFLVADRVEVITRAEGGEQLRWESSGDDSGAYSIAPDSTEPIEGTSGTRIVLHLKEEAEEYLDAFKLKTLLGTYSEFISFPVELWSEKTEYEQVPDEEAEVAEGEPPKMKTVSKTVEQWERINTSKPLWMRAPSEVTEEEYAEFYKTAFKAWDQPLRTAHFSLEGQVEFRCLLFVPSNLPWELSQDMFAQADAGSVKLYVKRVFISDRFSGEILPRWLSFMRALVDSEDLPLNVSRELLQKSKVLSIIAKRLVRKAIDTLVELSEDAEVYAPFYEQFGKYIKVGLIEDRDNKDDILKLARFESSRAAVAAKADGDDASPAAGLTSLADYVSRMPEDQKQIYFVAGTSRAALEGSPQIERLTAKGYEVLFATDSVDEIALQGVGEFEGKQVVDAAKQDVDLGGEDEGDEEKRKADAERLADVLAYLKDTLGGAVDKVEVSKRLTSSPAALVQPQWGMSPQMERFMKAQAVAMGQPEAMGSTASTAILEVNADHPVLAKLEGLVRDDRDSADAKDYAQLVYDVAAVTSGYEIANPTAFAQRVTRLMAPDSVAPASAPSSPQPAASGEKADTSATPKAEVEVVSEDESSSS
mmetsp:Transcript_11839/g.31824  ORF Transcript_11839/g.31824 Transcript_11839/m.31824 type:complete len:783 (+) Transcript_11839:3-2351(+)